MSNDRYTSGILISLGAYLFWGLLPMYWKALGSLPPTAILGYRIVGALVFSAILVAVLGQFDKVREALKGRRNLLFIVGTGLTITINWGVYIWAVNSGRIVEAALGYYINPLVSVILGVVVMKEKLAPLQIFTLVLAGIGVSIMAITRGGTPWIGLTLALSFGVYGLLKKMIPAPPLVSVGLETLFALPLAIWFLFLAGPAADPGPLGILGWVLVLGAGPVTALPLLLFAMGAQRIPLSMVGILQYSSPTISLLLGVFLYGEPFGPLDGLAFGLIWTASLLFIIPKLRELSATPFPKELTL